MACRTKYRLVKDKEARINLQAHDGAPAAPEPGQDDELHVLENGMDGGQRHGKEDQTTTAIADNLDGSDLASMGIDGHDEQDSGDSSVATGSSGDADAEEDDGGYPAHDPMIEDKE